MCLDSPHQAMQFLVAEVYCRGRAKEGVKETKEKERKEKGAKVRKGLPFI